MFRQFFSSTKVKSSFSHHFFFRSLYIVSLEYKVPLPQVELHIEAHRDFLNENYKNHNFIASGRKVPRTGGIIIASTQDKPTLEAILDKDPFKKNGIANHEITEFVPSMHSKEFSDVAQNDLRTTALTKK